MFADLRRAFGLLTVLPVGSPDDAAVPDKAAAPGSGPPAQATGATAEAPRPAASPGRSMAYYPLVGAVIGGILAGVAALLAWTDLTDTVPLLSAAIILAVWGGLTGALHLDGWADCCDALFVPVDRERRLEIMKDPRLGGFGAVGLILLLLVKFAALQGILGRPNDLLVFVAVAAAARWAAAVAAYSFPSARPGGMGDFFRRGLTWRGLSVATVIAIAAAAPLLLTGTVVVAAAALACFGLAMMARSRLGGLTGDVYGAIVEVGETLALVTLCFVL